MYFGTKIYSKDPSHITIMITTPIMLDAIKNLQDRITIVRAMATQDTRNLPSFQMMITAWPLTSSYYGRICFLMLFMIPDDRSP